MYSRGEMDVPSPETPVATSHASDDAEGNTARRRFWLVTALAIVAGFAVRGRVLSYGFDYDDFIHRAFLTGYPQPRAPWALYEFLKTPEQFEATRAAGIVPWWADSHLRMAFYRPLSSLTLAFDAAVFGSRALPAHAQNLLWWGALVAAVAWLWRPTPTGSSSSRGSLPFIAACVGVFVFALDEAHTEPVYDLSNRHSLISCAFAVLALGLHLRWRGTNVGRLRGASLVAFFVAILAGEYALTMLGYLLAFELFGEGKLFERARRLAPFLLIGGGYALAHALQGFGVRAMTVYLDPRTEPMRFVEQFPKQFSLLLQRLMLDTPFPYGGVVAIGVVAATMVLVRESRPWLVGALISILPTTPLIDAQTSRQLVAPAIGASAAVGLVVASAIEVLRRKQARPSLGARVLAVAAVVACVAVHGGYSAWQSYVGVGEDADTRDAGIGPVLAAKLGADTQRVVLLSSASLTYERVFATSRRLAGLSAPQSVLVLSNARGPRTITRVSAQELEVALPPMKRPGPFPKFWAAGDSVHVEGVRITIVARNDFGPTTLRLTFDGPIDEARWEFLDAAPGGYRKVVLPPVGGTLTVSG